VSTLFDIDPEPVNDASGDDLRVMVHRHLMAYPMLTVFEIARALRLEHPAGAGPARVRRLLLVMEGDGEAVRHEGPRAPGDHRKAIRWEAT
jgi:hypothetical protein